LIFQGNFSILFGVTNKTFLNKETTMNNPNGVVLYSGPSQFNGKPIIVIATGLSGNSENEKTGNMIQTYILCADINPVSANFNFRDKAICGDCKHASYGTCYVALHQGPYSVFYSYLRGIYPIYNVEYSHLFQNKNIRLGSYGDPAAVPYGIWENILKLTNSYTGYTHAWNNKKIDERFKNIVMASCDTVNEYKKAQKLGWRTFRIRLSKNAPIFENEFVCPAGKENENNHEVTCSKCLSCKGLSCNSSKSPVIVIHGTQYKINLFKKLIKQINNKKKYKVDVNAYTKAAKELRKQFTKIGG